MLIFLISQEFRKSLEIISFPNQKMSVIEDKDLVSQLLIEEAARGSTSVNLTDRQLTSVPTEITQLTLLERLGLGNNALTVLPRDLNKLSHLRYLNLKSNQLREIPICLTELPLLEILDISRNKIKRFPIAPGNLIHLKVWSLSKNRITHIPNYITQMEKLVLLKVDRNPIQWPPLAIAEMKDDAQPEIWLRALKAFLTEHGECFLNLIFRKERRRRCSITKSRSNASLETRT